MAQPTTRRAWLTGTIVGAIGALIGEQSSRHLTWDIRSSAELSYAIDHAGAGDILLIHHWQKWYPPMKAAGGWWYVCA